jgi:hypothetical protein
VASLHDHSTLSITTTLRNPLHPDSTIDNVRLAEGLEDWPMSAFPSETMLTLAGQSSYWEEPHKDSTLKPPAAAAEGGNAPAPAHYPREAVMDGDCCVNTLIQ